MAERTRGSSKVAGIFGILLAFGVFFGALFGWWWLTTPRPDPAIEIASTESPPEEVSLEEPAPVSTLAPETAVVAPASATAQAVEAAPPATPVPAPAPAETREELAGKPGAFPVCSKGEGVQCLAYQGWKIEVAGLQAGDAELISFARQLHDLKVGPDGSLKETTGTITFDAKEVSWSIERL